MRRYMLIIVTIMVVVTNVCNARCQEIDYYELSPELKEMQNLLSKNKENYNDIIDESPKEIILNLLKGQFKFNTKEFIVKMIKLMCKEIRSNFSMLISLTMVAILTCILKNMQSSFCSDELSKFSFYACNMVAQIMLMKCFNNCIAITKVLLEDVETFSLAVVPITTSLMISCGDVIKVSSLKQFILCGISMVVHVIRKVSLPLIYISTVLKVINSVTSRVEIRKLGKFIQNISTLISGFLLTLFIGVVALKGSSARLVDGITSRTAKYMFGAFIPVVGKYLSDIADSVIGALVMIKSVVGIASVLGIILICVIPIIKLASIVLGLKFMEAVLEPIVDEKFSKLIGEVATSISSMVGIVFFVGVVIILSIKIFLT